jgi:hypothetical protein
MEVVFGGVSWSVCCHLTGSNDNAVWECQLDGVSSSGRFKWRWCLAALGGWYVSI